MLDLGLIRLDGGTQSRVELNQETVAEYAEAYRLGADFPPVVVYFDGVERWLADGFHRYFGAKAAGLAQIYATVTPGTQRDAIRHSLGANGSHGVRRTNADKRKAVLVALNDAEWSSLPHKEIAAMCSVSREYVSRLASEIELSCDRSQDAMRVVTRNGKTYEQDTTKIGKGLPLKARGKPKKGPKAEFVRSELNRVAAERKVEELQDEVPILRAQVEHLESELSAAQENMAGMVKVFEANDQVVEAVRQAQELRNLNRGLNARIQSMLSEVAALKRSEKALRKKMGEPA